MAAILSAWAAARAASKAEQQPATLAKKTTESKEMADCKAEAIVAKEVAKTESAKAKALAKSDACLNSAKAKSKMKES